MRLETTRTWLCHQDSQHCPIIRLKQYRGNNHVLSLQMSCDFVGTQKCLRSVEQLFLVHLCLLKERGIAEKIGKWRVRGCAAYGRWCSQLSPFPWPIDKAGLPGLPIKTKPLIGDLTLVIGWNLNTNLIASQGAWHCAPEFRAACREIHCSHSSCRHCLNSKLVSGRGHFWYL